jgi:hypothetical protein
MRANRSVKESGLPSCYLKVVGNKAHAIRSVNAPCLVTYDLQVTR